MLLPRRNRAVDPARRADLASQAAADAAWLATTTSTRCVDGVERRIFTAGSGPLVVCVPVLSHLNFLYAPQIRSLCGRRRVAIYEPVVSSREFLPLSARVAELEAVMRTLGATRADFVGWSDGGIIACAFAAQHPEMVRSLSLLSLPLRFWAPLRAGARLLVSVPIERIPTADLVLEWTLARLLSGPVIDSRQILKYVKEVPQFAAVLRHGLVPLLLDHVVAPETITADALVVVGDRDWLVPVPNARELAARLAHARDLVVIPGGEHFLTFANADAVNDHLRTFLH